MLETEGDPELTEPLPAAHVSTEARIFPIICMGKGTLANITINYVLFSFSFGNTTRAIPSTTSLTHRSWVLSPSWLDHTMVSTCMLTQFKHDVTGLSNAATSTAGYTNFTHKADALIYALCLETTVTDRQRDLQAYGTRVISCLSDQGALSNN